MTLVYREELSINSCLSWGGNAFIFKGNASISMEKGGGEWKDVSMEICAHVSGKLLAIRAHGQILLWLSPAGQRVASVLVGITVFKKCWVPLKSFPHLCSSLCAEPQSGQPFVDL